MSLSASAAVEPDTLLAIVAASGPLSTLAHFPLTLVPSVLQVAIHPEPHHLHPMFLAKVAAMPSRLCRIAVHLVHRLATALLRHPLAVAFRRKTTPAQLVEAKLHC